MPVKRRNSKARPNRITPESVEAFRAGDYMALHRALGLPPWHPSPLPDSVDALGVNPKGPPDYRTGESWGEFWQQAVELQRELMAAVAKGNGG